MINIQTYITQPSFSFVDGAYSLLQQLMHILPSGWSERTYVLCQESTIKASLVSTHVHTFIYIIIGNNHL